MLPYLQDRPLVLTRFPDGIHGKSFYQRDAPEFVPEWIRREVLWSEGAEREVHYFIVDDAASLRYLINLGTIPIHTWHSRVADLAHPDWCVLDLDPKDAPFASVIAVARAIRDLALELELPAYLKTSGASGLHVLIPMAGQLTHDLSRTFAHLLARIIVDRCPDIATIARVVRRREQKVYIDYLQNGHGRLLVAPFSARAEPSAGVSMPLRWEELTSRLRNEKFNIKNAVRRMSTLKAESVVRLPRRPRRSGARAASTLVDRPLIVRLTVCALHTMLRAPQNIRLSHYVCRCVSPALLRAFCRCFRRFAAPAIHAATVDRNPFGFLDASGVPQGVSVDVYRLIAERLGRPLQVEFGESIRSSSASRRPRSISR